MTPEESQAQGMEKLAQMMADLRPGERLKVHCGEGFQDWAKRNAPKRVLRTWDMEEYAFASPMTAIASKSDGKGLVIINAQQTERTDTDK